MVLTRLLNLKNFKLECFEIGNLPSYLAVSHVWSENLFPASELENINACNPHGIQVLLHCIDGLVGEHHEEPYAWIDSWSIDQTNEEDKRRQIPLMGTIYMEAAQVVVVVNHHFSFSQDDWSSTVIYIREKLVWWLQQHRELNSEAASLFATWATSEESLRGWGILLEISGLEWCSRIWTAQEYILARKLVWIDLDSNIRQIKPGEVALFFGLQSYAGVDVQRRILYGISTKAYDDLNSRFLALIHVITGNLPRIHAMGLAGMRNSTKKEDEIYGLMAAAGVTIDPRPEEDLETIWTRWWQAAVNSGHLLWAHLYIFDTGKSSRHSNCLMPEFEHRCRAINCTPIGHTTPFSTVKLHDGTLEVYGKVAGRCEIDFCVGDRNCFLNRLTSLAEIFKGNPIITKRFCLALGSGVASIEICMAMADDIDRYYRDSSNLTPEEIEESCEVFVRKYRFLFKFQSSMYAGTKTYLGTVDNGVCKTDIIVQTGRPIPNGKLAALDLNAPMRAVSSNPDRGRFLMIVREPDEEDDNEDEATPKSALHKVGLTYPLRFWPTKDSYESNRGQLHGHIHKTDELQRFFIGGNSCHYCRPGSRWRAAIED